MKKILFTCISLSVIICANAQINKGSILPGGTFSGGYSNSETSSQESKGKGFAIRPSVGFAYKQNHVLGVSLVYRTGKTESNSGGYTAISRLKGYGGGVYFRRYFPVINRFSLFAQGDLNYDYQRSTSTNTAPFATNSINKYQRIGFYFSPGASFAVSKKIMIETGFGSLLGVQFEKSEMSYTGSSPQPPTKQNQFTVNGDAFPAYGINLGFRFVLGNK